MRMPKRKAGHRRLVFLAVFGLFALTAALWSGPPFFTDDSIPIGRGAWEFYLASQSACADRTWCGTAPHFEANFGGSSVLTLHVLFPVGYAKPPGERLNYGLGDLEFGFTFTPVKEKSGRPEIGIFPHIQLPTGSAARGLGSGRVRFFFPVWLSKHWGAWTIYGGGGFWVNPGPDSRNYWSAGWVVTRQLSKNFEVGAEIFRNTASVVGGRGQTAFNVGATCAVGRGQEVMISVGRDIRGTGRFAFFVGYRLLLAPKD